MIMFDVFERNAIPTWLTNIEAEIDSRMDVLKKENPDTHPLNIRTKTRTEILDLHNAKLVTSEEGGNGDSKSYKIVFETIEDYSWFMLRWG